MQFVIWYLTWILVRKASAPCNCGYCCPSGAELCGCSENLVSVKFGKSQPPEEMPWFVKYIPLKQLPFWGCYQYCLSYSWPFNSSVQRHWLTSERQRDAELIMNVLEKFLGGLDIAFRDIYESVSLEIEGKGFYGGQKPYVWLCWVIQYSFLLLSLFQD